jgi:hypothetical protein
MAKEQLQFLAAAIMIAAIALQQKKNYAVRCSHSLLWRAPELCLVASTVAMLLLCNSTELQSDCLKHTLILSCSHFCISCQLAKFVVFHLFSLEGQKLPGCVILIWCVIVQARVLHLVQEKFT